MSILPTRDLRRSVPGGRPLWAVRFLVLFGVFGAFLIVQSGISWLWTRPAFHKELINRYSTQYHFDPLWVMAIIRVESGFAPWAHSPRGAVGLMQLLPSTARELAPEIGLTHFRDEDLKVPEINLHLGIYYLSKLSQAFPDDENAVLAAYNAGPGITQTWRRGRPALEVDDIAYPETQRFVTHVQQTYAFLKFIQRWKGYVGMDHGK